MTRKSRPQQWADAVGKCQDALERFKECIGQMEEAEANLRSIQEEYEEWKDNLPESAAGGSMGDKLEEVCNLEIEGMTQQIVDVLDEVGDIIDGAEGADLPLGFGRD